MRRQLRSPGGRRCRRDHAVGGGQLRSRRRDRRQRPRRRLASSNGVFINDPKGLFILRWYREVKGDGTPPDGPRYQNRACKYYKLTSDNDGEAFRWTSNYQIISKVYLKKHSTLPLCYSLSAADKKMVTSTMKKMVGPEAE